MASAKRKQRYEEVEDIDRVLGLTTEKEVEELEEVEPEEAGPVELLSPDALDGEMTLLEDEDPMTAEGDRDLVALPGLNGTSAVSSVSDLLTKGKKQGYVTQD